MEHLFKEHTSFWNDGFKITSMSNYDTKITAPLVGYVHHHLIWNLQLSELAENSHGFEQKPFILENFSSRLGG